MRNATAEDARLIREILADKRKDYMTPRDIMKELALDISAASFFSIARNEMFEDPSFVPRQRATKNIEPEEPTKKKYERVTLKIPIVLHRDIQKMADAFGFADVNVWYCDAVARHYLSYKDKGFIAAATELLNRKDKEDGA